MNTNNVYIAEIYAIADVNIKGTTFYDLRKEYSSKFLRKTLVYHKKNGKFYDLLANRFIPTKIDYFDIKLGKEILIANTIIPFNYIVNNNKDRVPKRKIKKLYMDYNNLDNNK